ncbi:hypothetical protein K2173_023370 [Erythroxylum novogranatense]|uniref:Protein PIN-LIKES 3 n=1 Tax=Erythroxylum novogranatense TaxID=1862640 RepID=A0AAV8TYX8_9ROSI|nr:hypothetical protein K2173_023370 [Erythroxylum novogranatense]
MGIGKLVIAAFMPVLKVLLLTAIGAFLAVDGVDILSVDARKHLNNVVFSVFNPALVGSNLAKYITFRSMVLLWFMPLNILITFILGSLLGWLLIKTTKAPQDLWGLVLGCCAAGNLGNMPLIIIPAVCKESGSPFGDVDVCYNHGLLYVSISMAIGAIYMWSYVYNIMRVYSRKVSAGSKLVSLTYDVKSVAETPTTCCKGPLLPLNNESINAATADQLEHEYTTPEENEKVPFVVQFKQGLQRIRTRLNLGSLFAPSTTGAIVGFIVGLIPEFRKILIGDTAPLRALEGSASLLGDAAIPTVTLIVGGNLLKGLKGSGIQLSIVAGIILVRYIFLPIFGIGVIKSAVHFGFVPSDPLYQFVLLLQYALPPAMNIGTMTQLFGAGEGECSVILLTTYALASVSLTLWSAFFMWLVR